MRFKDIAIHNPDLNYPRDENSFYGYSGDFTVDATEELITVANKIRTRDGFIDFPSDTMIFIIIFIWRSLAKKKKLY